MVDGASPENKDLRTAMFTASGRRAVYPQLFLRDAPDASDGAHPPMPRATDTFRYVGDWESVSSANETNDTAGGFDSIFADVSRVAANKALVGTMTAGGFVASLASASGSAIAAGGYAAARPISRRIAPLPASPAPIKVDAVPVAALASPSHGSSGAASGAGAVPAPVSVVEKVAKESDWVEKASESGDRYWWNRVTKESSWINPTEALAAPSDGPDAPAVWVPTTDEFLRPFFYNYRTGETRWTL